MAYDPIAARYAETLFDAAKAQGLIDEALESISLIAGLLRAQPLLRQFMGNPDVDPPDKVGLLDRVLQGTWPELVKSYVTMVVHMDRADQLADIAEAYGALVDEAQGRLRVTVRSAHPLSEPVLERLRKQLATRQHKQVVVTTEIDPRLLGGLQVVMGHREIDGSVRRQLEDLQQQLHTVRVS